MLVRCFPAAFRAPHLVRVERRVYWQDHDRSGGSLYANRIDAIVAGTDGIALDIAINFSECASSNPYAGSGSAAFANNCTGHCPRSFTGT
jgi:hypothetical protein